MIVRIDRRHPSRAHITRLAQLIRDGRPVVLPTETQYALTCDATSRKALAAVRSIKGRQPTAPFSIFLPGLDELPKYKIRFPEYGRALATHFWPGPLTLILPTTNPIFKLLGGDGKSVGVRVTPEPLIGMILNLTGKALVATSANPSGVILDARDENRWLTEGANKRDFEWAKPTRYARRPASTIIDCTGNVPRELRPGPISKAVWNAALSRDV